MTIYDTDWWKAHPTHMVEQRNGTRAWAYEFQERAIADLLATFDGVKTVLEIGCGFGRVTKVVELSLVHDHYLATDASPAALDIAKGYVGHGVTFDILDLNEANDIAAIVLRGIGVDERADLVVAAEVLMHRSPATIERDVALLCAASARYVLTVDWYEQPGRRPVGQWLHPYEALFGKHGRVEVIPLPSIKQAIYLTEIER